MREFGLVIFAFQTTRVYAHNLDCSHLDSFLIIKKKFDLANLMKSVHIELSDKGCHVRVLVVVRQHLLGELEVVPKVIQKSDREEEV